MYRTGFVSASAVRLSHTFNLLRLSSAFLPLIALLAAVTPLNAWQSTPLIKSSVNETNLSTLSGHVHPSALPQFDKGVAPADLPMNHVLLVLKRSPDQQVALDKFLTDLQDPFAASYHHFLSPEEFGTQFGADNSDIQTISSWLTSHGFQINHVSNGRNIIDFSGTAGQVQSTFHAAIHKYVVNGEAHWANSTDPLIPAALASAVAGFRSLHDFVSQPTRHASDLPVILQPDSIIPSYTLSSGGTVMAPADFNVIYAANKLSGINGAGSTIAVVGRSNIKTQDVASFRQMFGLPASSTPVILNGPDPGIVSSSEEAEADLDVEWAGVAAPNATVGIVVSQTTSTSDGVDLSAEYIIDNNLADVMTESFSSCESIGGASAASFYSSLAQQAAAQGISWVVAAGDLGSACNSGQTTPAVNVIGSSPYTLTVGGTQFNENGLHSNYWNSAGTALQYIPEDVWNDDCTASTCNNTAGPYATGGGASIFFSKPAWQAGVAGIPNDGARDVPDISLSASERYSPYVVVQEGYVEAFGGTSAAAPSFSGILALLKQKTGARLGQAAPTLYKLAAAQGYTGCDASNTSVAISASCVFNDVTVGTNAVPGEANYNAPTETYKANVGYDLATGLGSVNISNLVSNWGPSGGGTPAVSLSAAALTFTSSSVASPSASHTVVLTNSGTTILSLQGIGLTGPNWNDFAQSNNCGTFLTAGSSCTLTVSFNPTATGTRTANLTITDNSGNKSGSTQSVALSGSVSAASTTPPVVAYLAYWGISNSGITVSWSTDLPSTTQLAFGVSNSLGQLSPLQSALTNGHGVVLTGLNSGTTYYFVAQSTAASGATGYSTTYSFTTSGTPSVSAPAISNVAATAVTGTSAAITWTTDQASSSLVNYGPTAAYGSASALNANLVTSHSVSLTGLTPGVTYNFDVVSANAASASSTSSNATFTTTTSSSGTPPQIGYLAFWGVTNSGVTISWSTDLLATTQVAYGVTSALGQLSPLQTSLSNGHGVVLTGLNPGTTYYFVAQSTGASGATGYSTTYNFTTGGTASSPAPSISAVTSANVTSSSVTISWNTDQPSSSLVNYGTSTAYGSSSTPNSTLVTNHSVTLTGLIAATAYNFNVVSANASGMSSTSANYTFATPAAASGAGPTLSYVAFWGVTSSGITISWATNTPATTYVAYGVTPSLGQTSPVQTALTSNHGVTLTGLSPGTTYYFVAESADTSGNVGQSSQFSFTTSGSTLPVISTIHPAPATNNTAVISWTTSVPTYNFVQYGSSAGSYIRYSAQTALTTTPQCVLPYVPSGIVHYQVVSTDAYGNQTMSPDSTFVEP